MTSKRVSTALLASAATATIDKSNPLEWPVCARCQKPVDALAMGPTSAGVRIRATCHGENHETIIGHTVLMKATNAGDQLVFGEAFHPGGEPMVYPLRGLLRGRRRERIRAPMVKGRD